MQVDAHIRLPITQVHEITCKLQVTNNTIPQPTEAAACD